MNTILINHRYVFTFLAPVKSLPSYGAHSGQPVKVLRQLRKEEATHPMFEIEAADGWIGQADLDELSPVLDLEPAGVQEAVRDFQKGACVFYLTPGGTLAILRRHYRYGCCDSIHGFDYPLRRPCRPKFAAPKVGLSIRDALHAGREILVGDNLAYVLRHLPELVVRHRTRVLHAGE